MEEQKNTGINTKLCNYRLLSQFLHVQYQHFMK